MSDRQSTDEPKQRDADQDERLGSVIAERYAIQRRIGRGAMGVVYEALHIQLKKRVALKVLRPELSVNDDVVQRFEREAIIAARIDHPSVVTASDFGELPGGAFYLVLEFVEGENLAALIRREAPLAPARAFQIAVQINAALIAAHEAGIIHRDLKPDNVMLAQTQDAEDFVKVLDFGIAKLADEATDSQPGITNAGTVFGTPEYMAPEQARGDEVDARADLYALGMLLYEMLCGTSAFRQRDVMAILTSQMLDIPPPLPESVPPGLRELVFELLAKDPALRPASASALGARFVELARRESFALPLPRTNAGTLLDIGGIAQREDEQPRGTTRPERRFSLALAAGAVALGGVLALLAARQFTTKAAPAPVAPSPQPAPEPSDDSLRERAARGDREALSELRRLSERELEATQRLDDDLLRAQGNLRAARRWLALGEGFSRIRHARAALDAYQSVVKLDPMLANHEVLLCNVRELLSDPDTASDAISFAQAFLGAGGADLIYDTYRDHLGQPKMTSIVARAQRIVKDKNFATSASPALGVAVGLDRAQVCSDYRELLKDAIAEGDERSSAKLEALRLREGCGSSGHEDCFLCLRKPEVPLEQAISLTRGRTAPRYLSCGPSEKRP